MWIFLIVESVHNYIDFRDFVIRKGAISAKAGEQMIIPFNMEDGILICEGKGNDEWNQSAPYGAGRMGSRAWAKKTFNVDEAKQSMKEAGVFSTGIPLDECKAAYKDAAMIEKAIEPTATIIDRIKPIHNMKDCSDVKYGRNK